MQYNSDLLSAIHAKDRQKVQELVDKRSPRTWLNRPIGPSGILPLVYAAKSGDIEFCRFLMDLGAYTGRRNDESPLFNAIQMGMIKTLKTLISLGFPVNREPADNYSFGSNLHLAVSKLNFEAIQVLLEAGADINQSDMRGNTPIHCICQVSNSSCNLNSVLDYFLLRPHISPRPDLNAVNRHDDTPLIRAVICKNYDAVKRLVKEGVDLDYISKVHKTALCCAIESESEEMTLSLLRGGCAVNVRSEHEINSPLACAVSTNNVTICDILMEYGANVDNLLHTAAGGKNPDMIDLFLKAGLSVNAQDEEGGTPLMYAAQSNAAICRHLIKLGARMDIVDDTEYTALQYGLDAADSANKNTLIYLIIEGSPRSELSYKTVEKSSGELRVLLLRFLLLTEISPLKNILDQMQDKSSWFKEFEQMASHPHSLKHVCRLNIREVLIRKADGRGILSTIEKLPLPQSIKSYLGYEEELQEAQLDLFYEEDEDE